MEEVGEAGGTPWFLPQPAAWVKMPCTMRVQVGGSLKNPGSASRGRQDWTEDLRVIGICPGRAWVGPGLQEERACLQAWGWGPGRGSVQHDELERPAHLTPQPVATPGGF